MKIYIFPNRDYQLQLDATVSNIIVNKELYKIIQDKKSEIDNVRQLWDNAKKRSNDYEYIYTSSNYHKNICNILPVSRSFFKLREIIYDYKLKVDTNSACIAEAPGGFIQSLLRHRQDLKQYPTYINGITLVSTDKDVPYWNHSLLKNKEVIISNGSDGTGDLYKLNNVLSFIKMCGKNSCQLVTGDGGFDYTTDFEQELSSYNLFYSEIMLAINIQKVDGTFICKLFDLFYICTMQLLFILYISYDKISFIKPLTSRQSNSEKYIVCEGFKGYNKDISNLLCSYFGHSKLPIQLPQDFITMIDTYHQKFINYQLYKIDTTLQIISSYKYNDKYNDKPSNKQLICAKEWCKKYKLPINKQCYYLY